MKRLALFALIAWTVGAYQVEAQAPQVSAMQSPGARAGNSVIPSTHSPGCGGVLCDGNDPERVAGAPPPPCQGLLCSLSPYSMTPPVTSADVARRQADQASAQAAAAPSPPPEKVQKRRRAKAKTSRTVATRTPDPSSAPPPPTPAQ